MPYTMKNMQKDYSLEKPGSILLLGLYTLKTKIYLIISYCKAEFILHLYFFFLSDGPSIYFFKKTLCSTRSFLSMLK